MSGAGGYASLLACSLLAGGRRNWGWEKAQGLLERMQAPPDAETHLSPAALKRIQAFQVGAALRAQGSHPKNKVTKRRRSEPSSDSDSKGDATISDSKEDSDAEADGALAVDNNLHGSTKEGKADASKQTAELMQGGLHASQPAMQPNPEGAQPQLSLQQPPVELQTSVAREQRAMENVVKAHSCMQARMADMQAVEQEQQRLQAKAEAARSEVALAKAAYVQALQAQLKIIAE
ncbi:hypothetical protein DUNSADRAFT_3175 [Dunaliella salina]|uniref:Uncharacterized protein n=1 Tax=Dunaliella salina TaxID=3046 RepID=A0ABQ7GUJ6_DUNSA|nr:hypothetical protein DUNSADRAFT_3175 [Dunaliella salina]|eukprot:KAF5838260.1 hypothetical protein DUNSADRAFT_3175 [Dunaliella salina]